MLFKNKKFIKFIQGNKITFPPDAQIYAVKVKEFKKADFTESYLNMATSNLNNPELLLNKSKNKILFYYPEFFRLHGTISKYEKEKIDDLRDKFNTDNLVILGYFQKHEVERYFLLFEKFNMEIVISDIHSSGDVYNAFGDRNMTLVLDEENRILYSDRVYILSRLVRYGTILGLLLFNGLYIPYVSYLINY
jgi:hypothetical protein